MKKLVSSLQERYPPFQPKKFISDPATITDKHGQVICWYLPNILTPQRQVCCSTPSQNNILGIIQEQQEQMLESVQFLKHTLEKKHKLIDGMGCWRQSNTYFKAPDKCQKMPPGAVNISPAWFQQAHDVSKFINTKYILY
jgi:hypothetical protein